MRLLAWELRKIWRPGILAAILLLGAVYYWMFPEFYIEYFCNGPASQAQFQLAEGEVPAAVYEYCNLHGLWKA